MNLSHPCNFGFSSGTRMLFRFLVKNSGRFDLQTTVLRKQKHCFDLVTKRIFLFPHKCFRFWRKIPQAFWTNSDNTLVVALPIHIQVQDIIRVCDLLQIFLDFLWVCTDKKKEQYFHNSLGLFIHRLQCLDHYCHRPGTASEWHSVRNRRILQHQTWLIYMSQLQDECNSHENALILLLLLLLLLLPNLQGSKESSICFPTRCC